jgi:WD40 repeat protein
VHDVATQAVLSKTASAHGMGIYDMKWLENGTFVTGSADNTIKIWSVTAEGKIENKDTFI